MLPINKKVFFDDITHSYINSEGELLIGVTSLLKKHGLSADYAGIPEDILNKAAERGSKIHKDIELFCYGEQVDMTDEVKLFSELQLKVAANEYLVSDNTLVASSIDLVLGDNTLVDIKTTSTLHIEPLTWQLSIYAYLFELQTKLKVPALFGLHIRNGKAKMVEIQRIPAETIIELLNAEREGRIYKNTPIKTDEEQIRQIYDLESIIIDIEQKTKEMKEKRDILKAKLYEEMEKNNLKQIDNELLKITRILPTSRVSVDSKKLSSEYPQIYDAVKKETQIQGTIKITIK